MIEQPDLFEWAAARPTAQIIDAVPAIAWRIWLRRQWPKPLKPCQEPINIDNRKRGAA